MPAGDPEWSAFLESSFLSVLETADEGLVVFDRDAKCRMIGRRAGEIFGVEPANYVGKARSEVLAAFARACEEPDSFLQTVGAVDPNWLVEPPRVTSDIDLRHPRSRTIVWTSIPIVRDKMPRGRLVLARDITRERSAERAQKQLQARLNELTPIDSLTGLPNVRRFREELEREHHRSTRAWDSYAVLRVDVDGMHDLNDELGVPVGDRVLEKVAECLKTCRREYDVVSRFEDDEFAVLLPGADAIAARTVAERMAKAVAAHDFELAAGRKVSASVGGCVWVPPSGETGEDILRRAGVAVIQARAAGAAQVHVDAGTKDK
jgi:diguanylate cyclase (GGDEF)-like protein